MTSALIAYATAGQGDVKRRSGREGFRLRVGTYRVLFSEDAVTALSVCRETLDDDVFAVTTMTVIRPQFFRAGEEELVVLTRAEFDMLMTIADREEDIDDGELFDTRMTGLANGRDAPLPAEVNVALLQGRSLLEALRISKGLDLAKTASRSGVCQSRRAALEARTATWTAEEAKSLSAVLCVDPSVLI